VFQEKARNDDGRGKGELTRWGKREPPINKKQKTKGKGKEKEKRKMQQCRSEKGKKSITEESGMEGKTTLLGGKGDRPLNNCTRKKKKDPEKAGWMKAQNFT